MPKHQLRPYLQLAFCVAAATAFLAGEHRGLAQSTNYVYGYYWDPSFGSEEQLWNVNDGYCWLTGASIGNSFSHDQIQVDVANGHWQIGGSSSLNTGYGYASCVPWPEGYSSPSIAWTYGMGTAVATNNCFCSISGLKYDGNAAQHSPEFRVTGYPSTFSGAWISEAMTNDQADGAHQVGAGCLCPSSTPLYYGTAGSWSGTWKGLLGVGDLGPTSQICGLSDGRVFGSYPNSAQQSIYWDLEQAGMGFDWSLYNWSSSGDLTASCIKYGPVYQLSCGNDDGVTGWMGPDWWNDAPYVGGSTNVVPPQTASINRGAAVRPAPEAVYQHCRWKAGTFTETMGGFAAGTSHVVRLHFAENYINATNARTFNVDINGTRVLTNFDVWATAKAAAGGSTGFNIAVVQQFTATADGSGNFVIQFSQGTHDNPMISGIEIQ